MTLAYFKCRYELHEPTTGTAEETKAGLPATETGTGRIRTFSWQRIEIEAEKISLSWSSVTESNRRPSPYQACRFRLLSSGWVGLLQVGGIPVSEYVALCLLPP